MPPRFSRRTLLGATAGAAVLGPGALAACGDGSGGVSELTGSLITRWRADPFALGSYSYLAAGSTPGDRRAIAEPIGARLFFAGEATSSGFPATTQGALLSGQRAAQEVLAAGGGRTIVVGAGLAGLGAARLLTDEGQDVLVVEARDRIGGRTWTDFSLSAPADMGASWIHGVRGNPITAIANEAGLELARTRYGNRIVYTSDGEPIPAGEIPRLRSLFSSDALIANPSDAIGRYLRPELGGGGAEAELARFVASYEIEAEFAASIDELSIAAIDEGRALRGNDALIASGYSGIADAVAGGLDIRLGTPVERIADRPQIVTVSSGGSEESADRVIVTVPLGVLKAGTIEFEPKLPDLKQGAISRLGMGLLDKVYLQFDEVFWDPEPELLGYLAPDGRSYAFWLNLFRYTGRPILVAFNAADVAEAVEQESDEEIASRAVGVLRAIYG